MNYRKLWESNFGEIPKDERNIKYDIHHIDGNRKNNNLENLMCVSVKEHYYIHKSQYERDGNYKDFMSCKLLLARLGKSCEEVSGYTIPDDVRDKIRNTLKGVKHSDSRKKNVRIGMLNSKKVQSWSQESIELRRLGLLNYYKTVSPEKLRIKSEKISKVHKGKVLSDEQKETLSRINSKLTDEQVLEIDSLIRDGVKYKIISERFNISQAQISAIKQRKTYKWLWKL
jgi:DNA-binding NarL/FixJ family response regulator